MMTDIFSFTDYREYLKAFYDQKKKEKKSFSFRLFSKMAGLGGDGYLRMVMRGQRNLSATSIVQFAKALRLKKKELAYFEALVLYNQGATAEEKDYYFDRLVALRPTVKYQGLEKDHYEYITKKYFVVIREMVALPHFKEDPVWIAKHLIPSITPTEAQDTIKTLLRLGFLKRDVHGKLKHAGGTLTTPPEVSSIDVFNYHRKVLAEARDAIFNVPHDQRDVGTVIIPMAKAVLPKIKQLLLKCREDIAHLVNKGNRNFSDVYQISMILFPATTSTKKEKS